MTRHLSTTLAALSLLLCLSAVVLWIRSRFVGDVWQFPPGAVTHTTPASTPRNSPDAWCHQYTLRCGAGRLQIVRQQLQQVHALPDGRTTTAPDRTLADPRPSLPGDRAVAAAGFRYFSRPTTQFNRPPNTGWYWGVLALTVPFWALATLTAVPPALWLRHHARRRRLQRNPGACPHCGYDLRATPNRCPECGSIPNTTGA